MVVGVPTESLTVTLLADDTEPTLIVYRWPLLTVDRWCFSEAEFLHLLHSPRPLMFPQLLNYLTSSKPTNVIKTETQ